MTSTRRERNANYAANRRAKGDRQVTVWMSAETRAQLESLAKVAGSKESAVAKALAEITT